MNTLLTPMESAQHILTILREDVGKFPTWATPKYPVPSIMHTETQIRLMDAFAKEAGGDRAQLGITEGEIDELLHKAQVLRERIIARRLKRGETMMHHWA